MGGNVEDLLDLLDLAGKTAIISGGTRGIGRAIALRLGSAGAACAIVGRDVDTSREVATRIIEIGGKAAAIGADLRSAPQIVSAVQETVNRLGGVDILVNCAGIYPHSFILDVSDAEWDEVLAVNLRGSFLFSREAARQMIGDGHGGRIVNITSVDAVTPESRFTHYDASKGGLVALTKSMAVELGPYSINVNAVGPGLIDSPGLEVNAPKRKNAYLEHVPLGYIGNADDVANTVLFLCSRASRWITGQCIYVDGGVMLAGYMTGIVE
jgi:NAD(P)-dependent dehydrogenase (short-subunit alcohol dehydrogenase family)